MVIFASRVLVRCFKFILVISLLILWIDVGRAQEATPETDIFSFDNAEYIELNWLERGTASSVAWSPNGKILAVGGSLGVWLYKADTFEDIAHFDGHSDLVSAIAWNSDSDRLASADLDGRIIIWNVVTLQQEMVFATNESAVSSIAWSPDDSLLATGSQDGRIRIWDTFNGEVVYTPENAVFGVDWVAWSPDGRFAGRVRNTVCIYDIESGKCLIQMKQPELPRGEGGVMAWSPDGDMIATGGFGPEIWNSMTGELLLTLGDEDYEAAVAWSPDNHWLASNGIFQGIRIWDVTTGDLEINFESGFEQWGDTVLGPWGYGNSLSWSSDGTRLAAAGDTDLVRIWITGKQ